MSGSKKAGIFIFFVLIGILSLPSFSCAATIGETNAQEGLPSKPSRWTVSAEAIVFERVGTDKYLLVERVPGNVSFTDAHTWPSTPALNSTDLDQGFSPGFRVGAAYHADDNDDLEISFFRIADWDSSKSIGPDNPLNWLIMRGSNGNFLQTQDFNYQSMTWIYSTELYSAELNEKHKVSNRITLFGGFRWLRLDEKLTGTTLPMDRTFPSWELDPSSTLYDAVDSNIPVSLFPPFWITSLKNNLYGLQVGADMKLFELGRFSVNTLIKVGEYWNHVTEKTSVRMQKVLVPSADSKDDPAFVSEAGLQCRYQLTKNIALKLGYEVLWLNGVALAPGQIPQTYVSYPSTVIPQGVNTNSHVLFHGGNVGVEISF